MTVRNAPPARWPVRIGGIPLKIVSFAPLTATVALSPTDCLLLADVLALAQYEHNQPDPYYAEALRAALEACAIIAATDTLRDSAVPEEGMMDHTRKTWGASDFENPQARMVQRPA